jgi:hypothetical protein
LANVVLLGLRWSGLHQPNSSAFDLIPIDPTPYRSGLIEAIKGESVLESFKRIPSFDGAVWAIGDAQAFGPVSQKSYKFQSMIVLTNSRVQKILDECRSGAPDNAPLVKNEARKKFTTIIDSFGSVLAAKNRQILSTRDGFVCKSPDEYWNSIVYGPATTYLLAELNDRESLPLFLDALDSKGELPVNRVFLYFACHRIALSLRNEPLSADCKRALDDYVAVAQDVPLEDEGDGFAWDCPFDLMDIRLTMLNREVSGINAFKRKIRCFPISLAKFDAPAQSGSDELSKHISALRRFVVLLFPGH